MIETEDSSVFIAVFVKIVLPPCQLVITVYYTYQEMVHKVGWWNVVSLCTAWSGQSWGSWLHQMLWSICDAYALSPVIQYWLTLENKVMNWYAGHSHNMEIDDQ